MSGRRIAGLALHQATPIGGEGKYLPLRNLRSGDLVSDPVRLIDPTLANTDLKRGEWDKYSASYAPERS